MLEINNVSNICPSECINGLVRVAYDGQLSTFSCDSWRVIGCTRELSHQPVLSVVGVLVLIHQYVPETPTVIIQDRWEGIKHVHHVADEIIKIHRIGGTKPRGVLLIDFGNSLVPRVPASRTRKLFIVN